MKRSRRVVLAMMGSGAIGVVSMGFVPQVQCGPGQVGTRTLDGRLACNPTYGGFGGTPHHFHAHGHGHAHGGG